MLITALWVDDVGTGTSVEAADSGFEIAEPGSRVEPDPARTVRLNADGSRVMFETSAALTFDDADTETDVYAADLTTVPGATFETVGLDLSNQTGAMVGRARGVLTLLNDD